MMIGLDRILIRPGGLVAKRKLSEAQRVSIRRNIRSKVAAGDPQADILRTISARFKVSPETVRWYLKSASNGAPGHRPGPKSHPAGAGKKAASAARTRAASKRRPSAGGKSHRLLDLVRSMSEEGLKRALAAKRLLPRLEAKIAQKLRLEGLARTVRKALRAAEAQAAKLRRKVARLIAR
jgi:hypothetical protein